MTLCVDKALAQQCTDASPILFPVSDEFGDAEVLLVEATADELLPASRSGCVVVLNLDESVRPSDREH